MRYLETVFRPPSEAESTILQVTYGCSHNKCTFCGMYREKSFRLRPQSDILKDIQSAARLNPETRRVFLADGDAMVLKTEKLVTILEALNACFPQLQRVSIYSDAHGVLRKSEDELRRLKSLKLRTLYFGLESGNNTILESIQKCATAEEYTEAVLKAERCGLKASVIILLGIGGKRHSAEHTRDTARAVSLMSPTYLSALTVTVVPDTPLETEIAQGRFEMISPRESLMEMHEIVKEIQPSRPVIFRSNHASNYVPIQGNLPKDREAILESIEWCLKNDILRPEWQRGL